MAIGKQDFSDAELMVAIKRTAKGIKEQEHISSKQARKYLAAGVLQSLNALFRISRYEEKEILVIHHKWYNQKRLYGQ